MKFTLSIKKQILTTSLILAATSLSSYGDTNKLSKYGEPAVIEIYAQSAKVTTTNGKSTITLSDVDKLAAIASALHKDSRLFEAFPVAELPTAWNSCNAMKEENKLWHKDGLNSIVIFHEGADQNQKNTHLAKAPLITAPKDKTRTSGDKEGIAKLMLIDAVADKGNLSFYIKGGTIAPGEYKRVRIMTECIQT